jgi:hypothetical protein
MTSIEKIKVTEKLRKAIVPFRSKVSKSIMQI